MNFEHDLFSGVSPPLATQTSCSFNHNSQMVISSGADGKVHIFDLRKRDCISSWSVTTEDCLLCLTLSSDETLIYTLANDGRFSCWSLYQSGHRMFEHSLEDPYFNPTAYPRAAWGQPMALSSNGKHLLTCSTNGGVIYEFDASRCDKVLGMKGLSDYATCTDWSTASDCGPCITAAKDGQIRISTLLSQ